MELLPDDALLEMMKFLDIADLLACRLVCRRLGALAMLPEVWRHQRLKLVSSDDTPRYNQCSVLRLAPCLRAWHVNVLLQKFHSLYTTTRCAVRKLSLGMHVRETDAFEASLVIRNQAALGRLRRLSVWRYNTGRKAIEQISVLLGTVASTPLLEELKLTGFRHYPPSISAGLHRCLPGASLKSFEHDPQNPEAEHFSDFILSTHAATLQTVDLGYCPLTSTSIAALLTGMPNLRSLQCGMMPGLEAVAGCKQLRELELYVAYDGEARAAAEFLRRATQLVKVALEYESPTDMAPFSDVDFELALASTGRSRLEELELNAEDINDMDLEHFPQQQSLLKALPRLPALKHLEVKGEATDDFLLGISPATAPALRSLKVLTIGVKCAHDALHRGAVQNLLSLNPDLKFSTHELSYCYTDVRCAWCTLGCHQEMRQDLDPSVKHSADWVTIPRL